LVRLMTEATPGVMVRVSVINRICSNVSLVKMSSA